MDDSAVAQAERLIDAAWSRSEPRHGLDYAWWLLLPWLALSVALEDALRCWERRLR